MGQYFQSTSKSSRMVLGVGLCQLWLSTGWGSTACLVFPGALGDRPCWRTRALKNPRVGKGNADTSHGLIAIWVTQQGWQVSKTQSKPGDLLYHRQLTPLPLIFSTNVRV